MFQRSKERKPNRLKDFDYSQNGEYFITVCVDDMKECLGEVKNREMILNKFGEIVKKCWLEITQHFKEVELDEFQIMPNHIHGIINIYSEKNNNNIVGDAHVRPLQDRTKMYLSKVIHGFKSASSKLIHQSGFKDFKWERSFYDHIIETEKELDQIRDYIISNPSKWDEDRNNPKNLLK